MKYYEQSSTPGTGFPPYWVGNFSPGDGLLNTGVFFTAPPETMRIDFSSPVFGAGAQITPNDPWGDFVARITVFDSGGTQLATFTEAGTSSGNADNSAIFIGALSDAANIARIEYRIDAYPAPPGPVPEFKDFSINRLDFRTSAGSPIPEPGSLLVWSVLGLAGTAGCWWRKRRRMPL
jgi:hypothetical protein